MSDVPRPVNHTQNASSPLCETQPQHRNHNWTQEIIKFWYCCCCWMRGPFTEVRPWTLVNSGCDRWSAGEWDKIHHNTGTTHLTCERQLRHETGSGVYTLYTHTQWVARRSFNFRTMIKKTCRLDEAPFNKIRARLTHTDVY